MPPSQANLVALAARCTELRESVGHLLLADMGSGEMGGGDVDAAVRLYEASLGDLLRVVRQEEPDLFRREAEQLAGWSLTR